MTKKQYNTRNVTVGTVKKPDAESNLLILWCRGRINWKIDPKEHRILRCGRLACFENLRRCS
jgi:hypothetical protein